MVISEANSTPFTHKPSHDTGKHTSLHASTEIFQKHNVMKIYKFLKAHKSHVGETRLFQAAISNQ